MPEANAIAGIHAVSADPPKRRHLNFLDGLRAFAALCVLLSHTYTLSLYDNGWYGDTVPHSLLIRALYPLNFGHFAVAIFIVLSGFLLMMPSAASPTLELRGGFWGFIKRRGRRILPPYYAALVFLTALTIAGHAVKGRLGVSGDDQGYSESISRATMLAHVFLVHNLNDIWRTGVDTPMWSVAAEWQIYILFALLLLPIARRFGGRTALLIAVLIAYAPLPGTIGNTAFSLRDRTYLASFAFGMCAALIAYAAKDRDDWTYRLRQRTPWAAIWIATLIVMTGVLEFAPRFAIYQYQPYLDGLVGICTAAFIVACMRTVQDAETPGKASAAPRWIVDLLQSRPLLLIASFSYSLYLIHMPILFKVSHLLQSKGMKPMRVLAIETLVAMPLVVGIGYVFYLIFERPFLGSKAPRPSIRKTASDQKMAHDAG